MGIISAKMPFDIVDDDAIGAELPDATAPAIEIPDGFVHATKAQVAYWRQICGVLSTHGKVGMRDADWPPELEPSRITLRALGERRLIVRRGRAWHLRRNWYAKLTLLRLTAVPTPPLAIAERPAPHLPNFAELEQWELVCRWMDGQPGQRASLPILLSVA
jgi:hypothetical protein